MSCTRADIRSLRQPRASQRPIPLLASRQASAQRSRFRDGIDNRKLSNDLQQSGPCRCSKPRASRALSRDTTYYLAHIGDVKSIGDSH